MVKPYDFTQDDYDFAQHYRDRAYSPLKLETLVAPFDREEFLAQKQQHLSENIDIERKNRIQRDIDHIDEIESLIEQFKEHPCLDYLFVKAGNTPLISLSITIPRTHMTYKTRDHMLNYFSLNGDKPNYAEVSVGDLKIQFPFALKALLFDRSEHDFGETEARYRENLAFLDFVHEQVQIALGDPTQIIGNGEFYAAGMQPGDWQSSDPNAHPAHRMVEDDAIWDAYRRDMRKHDFSEEYLRDGSFMPFQVGDEGNDDVPADKVDYLYQNLKGDVLLVSRECLTIAGQRMLVDMLEEQGFGYDVRSKGDVVIYAYEQVDAAVALAIKALEHSLEEQIHRGLENKNLDFMPIGNRARVTSFERDKYTDKPIEVPPIFETAITAIVDDEEQNHQTGFESAIAIAHRSSEALMYQANRFLSELKDLCLVNQGSKDKQTAMVVRAIEQGLSERGLKADDLDIRPLPNDLSPIELASVMRQIFEQAVAQAQASNRSID